MNPQRRLVLFFVLILAFLASACNPAPESSESLSASPSVVTPTPAIPTQTPSPTPTPTPAIPTPTLFDTTWDDRTPFAAGLVSSAQDALMAHPGASIYHLDFTISDDLSHVSGKMEVRYTNTEDVALSEVVFRLFPNILDGGMTVSRVAVNGMPAKTSLEAEDSVLRVVLAAPLLPGEQTVISMTYQVTVPTTVGANYAVLSFLDDIVALAHAYPMIPAYDDEYGWYTDVPPNYGDVTYSDIAYYLVRVNLPANQVAQASGVEIDRIEEDGRQTLTFAAGPMRDFYFVSSARYQVLESRSGDTLIRAFSPPERAEANKLAMQYAIDALGVFNRYYGLYPYTEFDIAATPTLAGGVEYPGIVAIALSLYDPEQQFFEFATAHEVGHQWFYNVVGNDQIHHPWLDESLTQYNTLLYFKEIYGEAGYEMARNSQQRRWDYIGDAKIPLDLPVAAYDESEYSGIIYGRGGIFFDELRKQIGDEAFKRFQKTYYETYQWEIATTAGLKAVAEEACRCDLTEMFKAWVYPPKTP